ncbi:MAG TPA: hypothetical protein VEJ63_09285 [Planctomycetota bacterium]|nr:hypothetical protein [Planctomycetota bacterium]
MSQKIRVLGWAIAALLAVSFSASAADEPHPFKDSKVGDWVKHKQIVNAGGMKMETETKQTIKEKTEKEVTLEMEMSMAGGAPMKNSIKIPLDQKYEPYKQPGTDAEVKEIGKGEEKVTVAGKSFDTKWVEVEVINKVQGAEMKSKFKVWSATTVPVGGMVKMEGEMGGMGKTTMELIDFGSGK